MSFAEAARLAAIASLLEFGYWIVSATLVLGRGPLQNSRIPHYAAVSTAIFCTTSVASILFLLLIYRQPAGRRGRLALRSCAFIASAGSVLAAISLIVPPNIITRPTFLSRVYGVSAPMLWVCWAAFFGMFAVWAKALGRNSVRAAALATAVLQATLGVGRSVGMFRSIAHTVVDTYPLYPFPERLGGLLWNSAMPAVLGLFYWTSLCWFLVLVWKNRLA